MAVAAGSLVFVFYPGKGDMSTGRRSKNMADEFKNFIDGQWVNASDGSFFAQRNPANLDEVTGMWPAATRADAVRAIQAAGKAYPGWRSLSPYKRAEYLKKVLKSMIERRAALAEIITRENGKTLKESLAEVDSAIREMEYQIFEGIRLFGETAPAAHDGVFACSMRVPLGVVSIISPWNFPLNVPGRKLTPALMAGNTCVFKPSSLTPQTGMRFVELFVEAGLPAGVLNFITGGGSTVGEELVTNAAIKAITFTGSTEVGQKINQKASVIMARTQLEMGGKNPIIVLEDADLQDAAKSAVAAAFACAGQWCTSTSRMIVDKKIAGQLTQLLLLETQKIVVGPGSDPEATMGPVCGAEQLKSVISYIEIGKEQGAKLVFGGACKEGKAFERGCFIQPTIFADVTPDMTIAKEEIFGPVLSIMEVDGFAEAVALANSVKFGLASSIYTADLHKAFTFLEKTDAGLTHVNMMTAYKEPQLSFGGVKASGFGIPEAGSTGLEFFTEHKVAYIKYR